MNLHLVLNSEDYIVTDILPEIKENLIYTWADLEAEKNIGQKTYLSSLKKLISDYCKSIDLLKIEVNKPLAIEEILTIFFDSENLNLKKAALKYFIYKNNDYFRQLGSKYVVRSADDLQIYINSKNKNKLANSQNKQYKNWLDALLNSEKIILNPEKKIDFENFLQDVKNSVIDTSHPKRAEIYNLLSAYKDKFFCLEYCVEKILENSPFATSWIDLLIYQKLTTRDFSDVDINDANNLELNLSNYIDENHLNSFSVDNEDTLDVDDAISFEQDGDVINIYLHITAAADQIEINSPLFQLAKRTTGSLYIPGKVYPMLPIMISENKLSLLKGEIKPCLTLKIKSDTAGNIVQTSFYRSTIKVKNKYDYQQVEKFITDNIDFWPTIKNFTDSYRALRKKNGATTNLNNSPKFIFASQDKLTLQPETINASSFIQELAIFYNAYFAEKLNNAAAFAIYREQKTNSKYAFHSPVAGLHNKLGLPSYCFCTSPLRRFSDLINQKLIFDLIDNKKMSFDKNEILDFIKTIDSKFYKIKLIEKLATEHYKYYYLSQNIGKKVKLIARKKLKTQYEIATLKFKIALNQENLTEAIIKEVDLDKQQLILDY